MLAYQIIIRYTKTARTILLQVVLNMNNPIKGIANKVGRSKKHLMTSSWNLGKTTVIRVPEAIKKQILGIARHIDQGGHIALTKSNQDNDGSENSKVILLQDKMKDKDGLEIPFTDKSESFESILLQDNKEKIINILKHGITSKKQGGAYNSSNASTLKKEVLKVLEILED